jgi:hypothetical protein
VIPMTIRPIPTISPTAGGMRKLVELSILTDPHWHAGGLQREAAPGVSVVGWSMRASASRS